MAGPTTTHPSDATVRRPRVVVVGGGIAGLTAAHGIRSARPDVDVTVLEASDAPGGTARTDVLDGWTVDRGPSGFLASGAHLPGLVAALGLQDRLQPASDHAKARYLYVDGSLQEAPSTPLGFLRSGMLGPWAKARVFLEPFARSRPKGVDETVYDFAERRLGSGFADVFVSAMVRGVTAGDARRTSLAAAFPKMRAMEDAHGGLVRALVAKRVAERGRGDGSGPAGPGGRLTSFRAGGMQTLIDALAATPGLDVRVRTAAIALARSEDGYRVRLMDGEAMGADAVVVATPAAAAARLLEPLTPAASADLLAIPYAGARVVAVGYARADVPHDLAGFGFLVPPGQGLRMLGCQWSSSLFPDQAPAGHVLLRVIGGGVSDAAFLDLDDADALAEVRSELSVTLGIDAPPAFVHQVRWTRAIPQYTVGHRERVARTLAHLRAHPGLFLTGNAYEGVGVDACVGHAQRVAASVARSLGTPVSR